MGSVCHCSKKKDKYKIQEPEVLQLQDNIDISKKQTMTTGKINITASNFIKQKNFKDFLDEYQIINQLGKGAFGVVKMVKHLSTQQIRAMKIVTRKSIKDDQAYMNEIEILKKLDHPNILKLYEYYTDDKNFYLITEFCNGGELFDKIHEFGYFDESLAAQIMYQVFLAVHHCHSNGIVHRDLKPENILLEFTHKKNDSRNFYIKLIDFGTSQPFRPNQSLTEKTGTPYYVAPEVLRNKYNEKCDLWSCGVIMYILLTGNPPFNGENDPEIIKAVESGKVNYNVEELENISKEGISLMKKLLTYNPEERISAEKALEDPWIRNIRNKSNRIDNKKAEIVFSKLKTFKAEDTLAKASLAYLVNQTLAKEETVELRKIFQALDGNNDGKLSYEEIVKGFKTIHNSENPEEDARQVFEMADHDGSGFISYEEFLRATVDHKTILSEQKIEQAFKIFDRNGDGVISAFELKEVLGKGINISEDVWQGIIKEVDVNNDGEISLDEFKRMMKKITA